jgi:hypothetical protein
MCRRDLNSQWINDSVILDRINSAIIRTIDWLKPEQVSEPIITGETAEGAVDRFFIGVGDDTYQSMSPWRNRLQALLGADVINTIRERRRRKYPSSWDKAPAVKSRGNDVNPRGGKK